MWLEHDFVIDYSSDNNEMMKNILRNIMVNRLEENKPCVIFVTGASGEGKSILAIKLSMVINEYYGIDTLSVLDDIIVYTPFQYMSKTEALLFHEEKNRPDLKRVKVIIIDEARETMRAKDWYTFINRAIADCNAMSRAIKPMVIIIVSQFIKDIDSDVRHTFNFFIECKRPFRQSTRFTIEKVTIDNRDLERPKLRKRNVRGLIRKFTGKKHTGYLTFPHFKVSMPPPDITEKYRKSNYQEKAKIIHLRMAQSLEIMKKQYGPGFQTVESLVKYYMDNPDQLLLIRDKKVKKTRLNKQFDVIHPHLTSVEKQEFLIRIDEEIKKKGFKEIIREQAEKEESIDVIKDLTDGEKNGN